MEALNYNRWRQAAVLLLCGSICAIFLYLFLTPTLTADLHGRARMLDGNFGQMVVIPLVVVSMATAVWRAAVLLASGTALDFDDDGLVLTTMSGRHRMAWEDIHAVTVKLQRYGRTNWHRLCVHSDKGNRKLTLEETDLRPSRYESFVEALQARVNESCAGAGARAAVDAEAVLARYLEKKAEQQRQIQPVARGFGRKGL